MPRAVIGALGVLLISVTLGSTAVACGREVTNANADRANDLTSTVTRQTDANGTSLPFITSFDRRWNSANDGTIYEPCTALAGDQLAELGIDATSVRDAAGTNGQTARGCAWRYSAKSQFADATVTQIVGNSVGLDEEKQRESGDLDRWLSDIQLDGRVVGTHQDLRAGTCETYVQSGAAGVSTLVLPRIDQSPIDEVCDRAIAFTKATIDKMPP